MMPSLEQSPRDFDDANAWRVWADYLQSRGDPRGECVALELAGHDSSSLLASRALAEPPTPGDWRAALDEPAAAAGSGWPRLDAMLDTLARAHPEVLSCRWRYGMLEALAITDPWLTVPELPSTAELLEGVLMAPCAVALRELAIDRHSPDDVALDVMGRRGLLEWARPVFERIELPALRRLEIGDGDAERMRLSRFSSYMLTSEPPGVPGGRISRPDRWIGDLSWLLARLPSLRRVDLCGEGVDFAAPLRLPELESLRVRTRFLRSSALASLGRSELPELHTLELWLGNWPDSSVEFEGPEPEAFYGLEPTPELLRPLLNRHRSPALRRLGLRHCAYGDELVRFLVDAEVIDRAELDRLDLSNGFVREDGARALLEHASQVRVAELNLSGCPIPPRELRLLRARLGSRLRA